MKGPTSILVFTTSNYDAMIKFLSAFGFQITESPDQLLPLFNSARGARIQKDDLLFQLEETTSGDQKASFSLFFGDYSEEEVEKIKSLGYECDSQQGICGVTHAFRTPDGGTFLI